MAQPTSQDTIDLLDGRAHRLTLAEAQSRGELRVLTNNFQQALADFDPATGDSAGLVQRWSDLSNKAQAYGGLLADLSNTKDNYHAATGKGWEY